MLWFALAPGPSMSADLAARVQGSKVCAVGNTYELAPWADLLVANDVNWWNKHPAAKLFEGRKVSANRIPGVERVAPNTYGTRSNSGVLALDELRNLGARTIVLLGFDMHGTHFFGPYRNGCANTSEARRKVHHMQFKAWARRNPGVSVVNCTPGSALTAFPMGDLDAYLPAERLVA